MEESAIMDVMALRPATARSPPAAPASPACGCTSSGPAPRPTRILPGRLRRPDLGRRPGRPPGRPGHDGGAGRAGAGQPCVAGARFTPGAGGPALGPRARRRPRRARRRCPGLRRPRTSTPRGGAARAGAGRGADARRRARRTAAVREAARRLADPAPARRRPRRRPRPQRPPAAPPLPGRRRPRAQGRCSASCASAPSWPRPSATPEPDLARLAAEHGYADQAHLTNECTGLAGLPPGGAAQRSPRRERTSGRMNHSVTSSSASAGGHDEHRRAVEQVRR